MLIGIVLSSNEYLISPFLCLGLILHEENIGLLTPGYADIKEKLKKSTVPVVKGEIKMVGKLAVLY